MTQSYKYYKKKHPISLCLLLIIILIFGCNKPEIEKNVPHCIEDKIKDFNKTSVCNDAQVDEYSFQGKLVYVFSPGNCGADMTTEVFNSECKSLGLLGGISGNTLINGEEFSNATFVRAVWNK